nr:MULTISPECIES: MFS transporter [unclassified Enterococcus]
MGDFGCNMSFNLISTYLFIFTTQYIGIKLSHYAILIFGCQLADALNAPFIGQIVNHSKVNKHGDKFKPWCLYGGVLLAFLPILIFVNYQDLPYIARIIWFVIFYLLWIIVFSVVNVPYGAMATVITDKPNERSSLSIWRSWGQYIATTLISIFLPLFVYKKMINSKQNVSVFIGNRMIIVAIILGVIALISFILLFLNVTERFSSNQERAKVSYRALFRLFIQNRAMVVITLISMVQIIFINSAGTLGQLTFQVYFKDGRLNSFYAIVTLTPLIVGTIVGNQLLEKYTRYQIVTYLLPVSAIISFMMVILPIKQPFIWLGLQTIANSFAFGLFIYTWAFVAESIDYQEKIKGKKNEALLYSMYTMFRKMSNGLGQALIPLTLSIALPTFEIAVPTTWGDYDGLILKCLTAAFPVIGFMLIFILFKFYYPLNKEFSFERREKL